MKKLFEPIPKCSVERTIGIIANITDPVWGMENANKTNSFEITIGGQTYPRRTLWVYKCGSQVIFAGIGIHESHPEWTLPELYDISELVESVTK